MPNIAAGCFEIQPLQLREIYCRPCDAKTGPQKIFYGPLDLGQCFYLFKRLTAPFMLAGFLFLAKNFSIGNYPS